MKKMLFVSCFVLAFGFVNTSQAAAVWLSSKVKWVYPLASGSLVLTFEKPSPSCNSNATPYHYLSIGQNGVTELGFKNMMNTALTAFSTEKKLLINFEDATGACYINRLLIGYD